MGKIHILKDKVTTTIDITKPLTILLVLLLLGVIGYFNFIVRTGAINDEYISDYDPWWHFRHAKEIMANNYKLPQWDIFSFSPPGRPYVEQSGWAYTLIAINKIYNLLGSFSFMYTSKFASVIFSVLTIIPAYLLGRKLTNKWGGLATAFFISLVPTIISVTSIGYIDTDVAVVFYTFLTAWLILEAVDRKKWYLYIISGIVLFLFSFNWKSSWYIFDIFIAWFGALTVFNLAKNIIATKKIDTKLLFNNLKPVGLGLLVIFTAGNILALLPLGGINFINSFLVSFGFIKEGLIVNVSVAELQQTQIFTLSGFRELLGRISYSVVLALLFPFYLVYKLIKKEDIKDNEIFILVWFLAGLFLLTRGYRFGVLFSCVSAVAGGYMIGNIITRTNKLKSIFRSVFMGFVIIILLLSLKVSLPYKDSKISSLDQNWLDGMLWLKNNTAPDSVVVTWWDPGHIITGLAERRAYSDGAHCNDVECPISGHNTRIQHMGKIFSTDNETEALDILRGDLTISADKCADLFNYMEKNFKVTPPATACSTPSEVYYIASSDLIPKFTWLSYFGGYAHNLADQNDFYNNPGQCCAKESSPGSGICADSSWVYCPWNFQLLTKQTDAQGRDVYIYDFKNMRLNIVNTPNGLVPTYNNEYIIDNLYYGNYNFNYTTTFTDTPHKGGKIFLSSDLKNAVFLSDKIENSILIKTLYFGGQGLKNFTPVYSNSEMNIYKINLG